MNIFFEGVNQRGFGTYPLVGETARSAIVAAVEVGYRSFDTAQMYKNEADVWAALASTNVARDDICITTKVHPDNFAADRFFPSVEASIKALGGTPPDVLLLHWPTVGGDVASSLELLQQAHNKGLARNIGISNYTIAQMKTALEVLDSPIAINQVEFHPLIDQSAILTAASEMGIPLSAYCPIVKGKVLDHPEFENIGRQYGKNAIQVALRWILQKGVVPLPMSTKPTNIAANFDIMDFSLSGPDMHRIDLISKRVNYRHVADVAWAPAWDNPAGS